MCLFPRIIINPKYKPNAKNNYNPPNLEDCRVYYAPIGCGKCIECRKQKSAGWKVRLNEDIRMNKNAVFVTLTFDEEHLLKWGSMVDDAPDKIVENEIARIAVRHFLEKWRKKTKKSVRHWLITELGHKGTERIHIHGIIWTYDKNLIIEKWDNGFVYLGTYVNETTIGYIVKYITKIDSDHKGFEPKIFASAGIGAGYFKRDDHKTNKFNGINTREYYQTRSGYKLNLPKYYRNKIYSDDEKEKLWINKLDKNERWVLGTKIDISKSEDRYYTILKQAHEKNKRLGYGDDTEEWSITRYKKDRKKLKKK